MTTWADQGIAAPAFAATYQVANSWTGLVERFSWLSDGIAGAGLQASALLFTDWHGWDVYLARALTEAAFIYDWNADQPHADVIGQVTTAHGAAVEAAVVRLYNRSNRSYIREAISNPLGGFSFSSVPGGVSGEYVVMALPVAGSSARIAIADHVESGDTVSLVYPPPLPTTGLLWPNFNNY